MARKAIIKTLLWVLFIFLLIFVPASISYAEDIVKTFTGDQFFINLYQNRMELADNNSILLDQYRVDPWVIVDGCLLPGEKVIIVILGREGETRGERLACYGFEGIKFQKKWIDNNRKINPWKILSCDVEGDGRLEVAVGVWKTARFHPVFDNRLFIYAWVKGMIYPKWLGSRLSSPFVDFDFQDFDRDDVQELIALEYQKNGLMRAMGYEWTGFGFIGTSILGKDLFLKSISEFWLEKEGYS